MEQIQTYYYPIPGYIKKEIEKKGFYLYEWVDETELKASIERDYLKIFQKFGIAIAIFLILPTVLLGFSIGFEVGLMTYFGLLAVVALLIFFYLFFLSVSRSLILRNIAYIIITSSHFRILKTIEPIREGQIYGGEKIKQIGALFEEELFRPSEVKNSKTKLFRKVSQSLFGGYDHITQFIDNGRYNARSNDQGGGQLILIVLVLYTLYLISVGLLYGVGIFIVIVLGNIFAYINRKFLLITKNEIIQISDGFERLDDFSKNIEVEKRDFLHFIQEAQQNNWMNGLLLSLERSIEDTNFYAKKSYETLLKLKSDIENSKYSGMFEPSAFKKWIENQITEPLIEIQKLLKVNIQIVEKTIVETSDTAKQFEHTKTEAPVLLSIKRLEMQKQKLHELTTALEFYITKLRS